MSGSQGYRVLCLIHKGIDLDFSLLLCDCDVLLIKQDPSLWGEKVREIKQENPLIIHFYFDEGVDTDYPNPG